MNYRHATILAPEDLGVSGTKTIELNIQDIISRIDLRWEITRSKSTMDAGGPGDISKIELVDGSDVLHSLNGYENQALCLYDRRVDSMCYPEHLYACGQETIFGIDFGRYLFDPLLAFDPKRFRNPQLKITWSEIISDTGCSDNELEILAHVFDEKVVNPIGFLMAKELYSYTCGSNDSYEHVNLPTDYPIRQILVRAYRDAYEPWAQIDEARLDEDNLKRIPFDYTNLEDYMRSMIGVWSMIKERIVCHAEVAGAYSYYVTPTDYWVFASLTDRYAGAGYITMGQATKGGKITPYSNAAVHEAAGVVTGYLPWHCFQFPFGDQKDMEDWYDVTKIAKPSLRLRAASSAGNGIGQVVLQQLRRY